MFLCSNVLCFLLYDQVEICEAPYIWIKPNSFPLPPPIIFLSFRVIYCTFFFPRHKFVESILYLPVAPYDWTEQSKSLPIERSTRYSGNHFSSPNLPHSHAHECICKICSPYNLKTLLNYTHPSNSVDKILQIIVFLK